MTLGKSTWTGGTHLPPVLPDGVCGLALPVRIGVGPIRVEIGLPGLVQLGEGQATNPPQHTARHLVNLTFGGLCQVAKSKNPYTNTTPQALEASLSSTRCWLLESRGYFAPLAACKRDLQSSGAQELFYSLASSPQLVLSAFPQQFPHPRQHQT